MVFQQCILMWLLHLCMVVIIVSGWVHHSDAFKCWWGVLASKTCESKVVENNFIIIFFIIIIYFSSLSENNSQALLVMHFACFDRSSCLNWLWGQFI